MAKNTNFCFCTLALGKMYRLCGKQLAKDIEKYSPGTEFIVLTDKPKDFVDNPNVSAFKHRQKGLWRPYNDKRFAVLEGIKRYKTVIFVDADSRLTEKFPANIEFCHPGHNAGGHKILNSLGKASCKRDLKLAENIANKLNIGLNKTGWVWDSFFILTRDEGKELEFIKWWGIIAEYLELHRFSSSDGYAKGLAISKVGWKWEGNNLSYLESLRRLIKNNVHGPGRLLSQKISLERLKRRVGFHLRMKKAHVRALRDFNFFYR